MPSLDSGNDHGHRSDPGCWAAKFHVIYVRINDFSVQLDAALRGRPRNEKHARGMRSLGWFLKQKRYSEVVRKT